MLKIRLGKIVDYAQRDGRQVRQAVNEFFGNEIPGPDHEYFEEMSSLFNEWLVFDFKPDSSRNWLTEYCLKNPDALPSDHLSELEQIIRTQVYDLFEIVSLERGVFMNVYGMFSGKEYKVWERSLSSQVPDKGSFWNRVANVNGKWMFVGSNPSIIPLTHTPRMKKILLNEKDREPLTAKLALGLYLGKDKEKEPEHLPTNDVELFAARSRLEKRYKRSSRKYGFSIPFERVVDFVFQERYRHNHADVFRDIGKLGIPDEAIMGNLGLFQDIWNHFPHKRLKGKSPTELFAAKRRKK